MKTVVSPLTDSVKETSDFFESSQYSKSFLELLLSIPDEASEY